MKWSPQQDQTLVETDKWIKDKNSEQVRYIAGFAGSGKTTIAKEIASTVPGDVHFAAYTGKAAHVLQKKGCDGATTIHSLIYHSREQSAARLKALEQSLLEVKQRLRSQLGVENQDIIDGDPEVLEISGQIDAERKQVSRPSFQLNYDSPLKTAKLLILDECSMVDGPMAEDLLFFGTKILVLGDPFQLPPVAGSGYFTNRKPDTMLTEIHRQARDNPIIALATAIRAKERLSPGQWGDSRVLTTEDLRSSPELATGADQVLVGRNITRRDYNKRLRQIKHDPPSWLPVDGERLVCLRNNKELGLFNGATWFAKTILSQMDDRLIMSIVSEDGIEQTVEAHTHYFQGKTEKMPFWEAKEAKEAQEFDFGHALTVHKSQGSQWDNVCVFDESFCFARDADKDMKHKWLYTAVTRAAERVTVCLQ